MSSFLNLGDNYEISLQEVFALNREKLVDQLVASTTTTDLSFVIYLEGGPSETRFDSDHEPLFRQESYFMWLTGVTEPDCAVSIAYHRAVDATCDTSCKTSTCTDASKTTTTTLFIPRLPESYATIMGRIKSCDEWKDLYQVDHVEYMDVREDFLLQQLLKQDTRAKSTNPNKLFLMYGENSDSGKFYQLPNFIMSNTKFIPDISSSSTPFMVDTNTLFPILANARVHKSKAELHLLRHVAEVTSFAHVYVMHNMKNVMFEYQAESLFRHYCYYNYACRLVAYTPICGCGPNSAILHYGHTGEPNARTISKDKNDLCLFDMGAEYFCYGADVTCTFPANGSFTTPQQRGIYGAVLAAQKIVFGMLKPGVSYRDCHKAAEKTILEHLIRLGIVVLKKKRNKDGRDENDIHEVSVDELVDMRLGAVFMPHGLGHFIGLDTHDVGGYLPGTPERILLPGLKSLRTARILEANMVLTVEPGCYFIDHLLNEALADDTDTGLGQFLNASVLEEYRGLGGVRLEDVVAITETGFVNYTLCPRTIQEVESVMAGGKWPPHKDDDPQLGRERLLDPTPLPAPPSMM